jgi:hypothetical protein
MIFDGCGDVDDGELLELERKLGLTGMKEDGNVVEFIGERVELIESKFASD